MVIKDSSDSIATDMNRNVNVKLASAEALQLMGGFSDPEVMGNIAPNTRQFRTGGVFNGAYGPRIRPQLEKATERLRIDGGTRQAVVTVWDPLYDQQDGIKDIPCTVSYNWHIRDDKLHQTTHMRSNDIWWGWTYDLPMHASLLHTMAHILDVGVGDYVHVVDSLHIYERDIHASGLLHPSKEKGIRLTGITASSWEEVRKVAHDIFYDNIDHSQSYYTASEMSYHGLLHG